MTTEVILQALRATSSVMFTDEAGMQAHVESVLQVLGVDYRREAIMGPRDRIDFLVGAVGIECKIDHGRSALLRQLDRYAGHGLEAIIVVLGKIALGDLPRELRGVPIYVVNMMRAFA
jgi:hypothetical protein